MKHPLVEKLEKRLLPEFEEIAEKIRREIPNIKVEIDSYLLGSQTIYQGCSFGIDCILTDVSDDEPSNIALEIDLCHITTVPRISADVCWLTPSSFTEAEFYEWDGSFTENGLILTEKVLEDLFKALPRLYEALFEALRRRKPNDLC